MKLQILVPQYNETDEVIKPLFDSIALQQNVPFDEIGVIVCNDGSDTLLSPKLLNSYPFKMAYLEEPHRGVSATRNACLRNAEADYVMFCDADDIFYNACGLWIVFREMEAGFDSLVSMFIEETRDFKTGKVEYINHEMDSTFVHGKIHRRQYLIDNKIQWNEKLTVHEDSYFNILAQKLSKNVKYCQTPFYLWRWRDNSVCRHDPKYLLKTFKYMIDSSDCLVDEFTRRDKKDQAMFYASFMIFESYYMMNKPEWISQENKEYRDSTELRFAEYYQKHKEKWNALPLNDKMVMSSNIRSRNVMEGMTMENVTIGEWLEHIESL